MSQFLFSNFPPLKTSYSTYRDLFTNLIQDSEELDLATGYISTDSLLDLRNIVESNGGPKVNLCVGMHYFEGISQTQSYALQGLDTMLRANNLGTINVIVTFPFHGKVVSFSKNNNAFASILGSSNLSNIVHGQRLYEADVLFEGEESRQLNQFIKDLTVTTTKPFVDVEMPIHARQTSLLPGWIGVNQIPAEEVQKFKRSLTAVSFDLPLKGDVSQKSGLNAFFGKGRENKDTGFVIPRSWYEVELIIPKTITTMANYPQVDSSSESGVLDVITDDGWNFQCKVSGSYSKNFRSRDDLKILGRWIKGRLEAADVLKPGNRVTNQVLQDYGRSNIQLTRSTHNKWFLDFGVQNG